MASKIVLILKDRTATAHTQTVSSKKLNAAKHNSVYTLKIFISKTNRAFALKEQNQSSNKF
jgi:hypothetical protein